METAPIHIELTTVKPTGKRQTVDVNITFSAHVGWAGALVLLFSFGIAGTFAWLTFRYTNNFVVWGRPLVWVFPVLATLYILLVLKFLFTWKNLATESTVRQQTAREVEQGNEPKRAESAAEGAKMVAQQAKGIWKKLQMDGPWFLWKLYLSELLESVQQCVNITTVYLCCLPIVWTSSICFGLSVDCFHTVHTLMHKNTPTRRDRQVKIDMFIDFLCMAIPSSVGYSVYDMPISISEMLSISLMPAVLMLGKLDDILEQVVYHRSAQQVLKKQKRISFMKKRRRESIFENVSSVEMAKTQEDSVPRQVRFFVAGSKGLFGLFFLVVAMVHLILKPTGCDEKTWGKGCVNKIPFCKSLFVPTCNCAVMRIENDYNLTVLPDSLPLTMTGLRKVRIYNCSLTTLPPDMEQLTHMTKFEVVFNHLQTFDVDVRKWERLIALYLNYNNISTYNEEAVWTHGRLEALALMGNSVKMPDVRMSMPSLAFLHLGENNMIIDAPFDKESFPSLVYLYLNGNSLQTFPSQSLGDNLVFLGVARCDLTSLPTYLSGFKLLKYLDARDNNITAVSEGIKNLIKTNSMESYFSGNDRLCASDTSLDCQPLCSNVCYSRLASGNGQCDISCNSDGACKYDSGECK